VEVDKDGNTIRLISEKEQDCLQRLQEQKEQKGA
jgi:hypothetical protein